jgi:hypothetical protein
MKAETPTCKGCLYRSRPYLARITGNNNGRPRASFMCEHPKAFETFSVVFPRSNRMARFIGYSAMGGNVPQIKTSPRWCPLRSENKKKEVL